jgi:hypothetical protein
MTASPHVRNPENGGSLPANANLLLSSPTNAGGQRNAVSSLTFADAGRLELGPDQTLKVSSGVILALPGMTAASTAGGALDFGNTEAWCTQGAISKFHLR